MSTRDFQTPKNDWMTIRARAVDQKIYKSDRHPQWLFSPP